MAVFYTMPLYSETDKKIVKIEHRGLKKTRQSTVDYHLIHKTGDKFDTLLWGIEKDLLIDLDIFADVWLEVNETGDGTELIYNYKELP